MYYLQLNVSQDAESSEWNSVSLLSSSLLRLPRLEEVLSVELLSTSSGQRYTSIGPVQFKLTDEYSVESMTQYSSSDFETIVTILH